MGKTRHPQHRLSEKLKSSIFILNRAGCVVNRYLFRPNLPEWWFFRVFLTGFTGCINRIVEYGEFPVNSLGIFSSDTGIISRFHIECANKPVGEIVGEIYFIRKNTVPAWLQDFHATLRKNPAAFPVINHFIGNERIAIIGDLHISGSNHNLLIIIKGQIVGFKQHLRITINRGAPRQRFDNFLSVGRTNHWGD